MMKAVNESKPEVGSSRRITLGFVTNSKSMDVLFLSPPENSVNLFLRIAIFQI